jgi:hypothetical protein
MSLGIRKIILLSIIGAVFLAGNILVVANWLIERGVEEKANWIRQEFLTGTAIAVIIALLILLVSPKGSSGRAVGYILERISCFLLKHCRKFFAANSLIISREHLLKVK